MLVILTGSASSCSTIPEYGKAVKYKVGQPIQFPDLTLTCIESGEEPDECHGVTLVRKFRINAPSETVYITYKTSCMDHDVKIATCKKIYTLDMTPQWKRPAANYLSLSTPRTTASESSSYTFEEWYNICRVWISTEPVE